MSHEPQTHLDKEEARQGETGHNVRYVLIAGLVLAGVAFLSLMAWWFGPSPKI